MLSRLWNRLCRKETRQGVHHHGPLFAVCLQRAGIASSDSRFAALAWKPLNQKRLGRWAFRGAAWGFAGWAALSQGPLK